MTEGTKAPGLKRRPDRHHTPSHATRGQLGKAASGSSHSVPDRMQSMLPKEAEEPELASPGQVSAPTPTMLGILCSQNIRMSGSSSQFIRNKHPKLITPPRIPIQEIWDAPRNVHFKPVPGFVCGWPLPPELEVRVVPEKPPRELWALCRNISHQ